MDRTGRLGGVHRGAQICGRRGRAPTCWKQRKGVLRHCLAMVIDGLFTWVGSVLVVMAFAIVAGWTLFAWWSRKID